VAVDFFGEDKELLAGVFEQEWRAIAMGVAVAKFDQMRITKFYRRIRDVFSQSVLGPAVVSKRWPMNHLKGWVGSDAELDARVHHILKDLMRLPLCRALGSWLVDETVASLSAAIDGVFEGNLVSL
jgi:hypothetical protein